MINATQRRRAIRATVFGRTIGSFAILMLLLSPCAHAVAASLDLLKAKQDAETRGYIFFTTHNDIIAMAKKEVKLRVSSGLNSPNFKPWITAFKQRYPFVNDIHVEGIQGKDAHQRFTMEMKAGEAKGWDITQIPIELSKEYPPHLMKHDILGMAKYGILKIPTKMIHPVERSILSYTTTIHVITYNRKLIPEDKVPAQWEDFLKPEFKGKKFVVDLRPSGLAGLVPAWGLERTLDFARRIAAQQPIWGIGISRINTAIAAGEYSLYVTSNFSSVQRAMSKDPTGNLSYKIVEPVPTRVIDDGIGILNTAEHPNTALLWLEFLASPEGQEIIDRYEPLRASVFTPGSSIEQMIRSRKQSIVDWEHFASSEEYHEKILAVYGFPKADK